MYETLIIPKKHTAFSVAKMQGVVQKFANNEITAEKNENGITLRKGNNFITVAFSKDSIVLEEAKEMAVRFGIPIQDTDERFEMYGKDDDDVLYNQFLNTYEYLRYTTHLFYILDQFTGELSGKDTPITSSVLQEFIYVDEYICNLEKEIADIQQRKFNKPNNTYNTEPRYIAMEISRVNWVGVNTLEDLIDLLHTKRAEILAMTERFVLITDTIYLGTSLKFLSFELVAQTKDEECITNFVRECVDSEVYKKTAKALYKVYAK